jgi:hypothetical protein
MAMTVIKSSSRWLLAAGLLAAAAPLHAAQIDPYLPNDAQWMLNVNVRQLLDSPIIKKYALPTLQEKLKESKDAQDTLTSLGFDPLQDINSVTVAGPGVESDNQPKFLAIIHGKFDVTKFQAKAQEAAKDKDRLRIVQEGGYTLYQVPLPGGPQGGAQGSRILYAAIIDESTLVFALDKDRVIDALDKKAGKKQANLAAEFSALLQNEDPTQSISFVILGNVLTKAAPDETVKEHVSTIKKVVGAIKIGSDVKLGMSIDNKDASAAKDLQDKIEQHVEQAKGAVELYREQLPMLAVVLDVLDVLKVNAKDRDVTIKAEVGADKIDKALNKENKAEKDKGK